MAALALPWVARVVVWALLWLVSAALAVVIIGPVRTVLDAVVVQVVVLWVCQWELVVPVVRKLRSK